MENSLNILLKNNHSPIVSEEIFYDVQNEKLSRSYYRRKMQDVRPNIQITMKLICDCCGDHYLRVRRKGDRKNTLSGDARAAYCMGDRYCTKLSTIRKRICIKLYGGAYSRILHIKHCSDQVELGQIADQMADRKKMIFRAIQENVQGFWVWNDLMAYYANVKNEYDELSELLLRKFLEREESMFIRCPFKHNESIFELQ